MATEKDPPPDPLDGYKPTQLGDTSPQRDPEVKAAARKDAEGEQRKRGVRWDEATLDAFVNALTGLGDPAQDKVLGGINGSLRFIVTFLAGTECEDRWRGSDLGGRVVEQVPAEMTRMGFELAVQPDDDEGLDVSGGASAAAEERVDPRLLSASRVRGDGSRIDWPDDQDPGGTPAAHKEPPPVADLPFVDEEGQRIVEEMEAQLRELDALGKFRDALEYERAYGGAGILIGADDGVKEDLTIPLQIESLAEIKHLTVFRGGWDGELIAWRYYSDPRKANYGMPQIYMLRNLGVPIASPPAPGEGAGVANAQIVQAGPAGALIYYVHESRLLIFPGKAVSRRTRVQMRGWGDSIFMRVDEVLSQYSQTWQAIANIMVEWSMGVLKMEGLADLFASQGDPMPSGGVGQAPSSPLTALAMRIRAINLGKSNAHTFLIDGNEEFRRETSPLSGLAEVLQSFMLRLAAAVDMPVSLLMGQSPGGLRAGDDDVRFFYDRIMSKIGSQLMPAWRKLLLLLFLAKRTSPTGGQEPRKWTVTPRPLRQLNEKETAEVRKLTMETDVGYINVGVQSAAETTSSRFGGSKWSAETTIDFEARVANAKALTAASQKKLAAGGGAPGAGEGGQGGVELTPSAESAVITVNEARAAKGLGPWPDEAEGKLTVAEFMAKKSAVLAIAANAEAGTVGTPPAADKPDPVPPIAPHPGETKVSTGGTGPNVGSKTPPHPGATPPEKPGASPSVGSNQGETKVSPIAPGGKTEPEKP